MRYTLFSLAFLTAICFTACDDSKEYGDGLEEKTLISEITLANVENGKLTLAASVDYMDSLIQCKIVPEQPTNRKVSWSSSDENVATVTQDGLVHAVSAGKANIVVTPEIGFGASTFFELTVVPEFIPIADFEFTDDDKKDLYVSEERSLRPTLLPAGHTYSMVTWKSSDESIATVTKEGVVAGPRVLEHMVDTVLYFEGDRHASYRILRAVKNRFGSTNEIGVFEMQNTGLEEVRNPSEFLLNGRPENASGSVVACSMEGTRPILVEIQALVCQSNFGIPRRTAVGTDFNRVNLLMAVLEKKAGIHLAASDAYVNIAGGMKMTEPAIDLGICLAIISSAKDIVIPDSVMVFGEIGLSGEVRAVSMAGQRVQEAKKLGFETVILPEVNRAATESIRGIQLVYVAGIRDAISYIMR